jgi:hypothetical protein
VKSRDVTLGPTELGRFTALLQRGVALRLARPCSVLAFLVGHVGLTPEYVAQRITTVFLDGQVVDVLERAMLREGSRLALSAAMPGLVGATLRRSGAYAAMRAEITRAAEHDVDPGKSASIVVHVKLFNLLIQEIGPALLERGVLVEGEALHTLAVPVDAHGAADGLVELRVRFR